MLRRRLGFILVEMLFLAAVIIIVFGMAGMGVRRMSEKTGCRRAAVCLGVFDLTPGSAHDDEVRYSALSKKSNGFPAAQSANTPAGFRKDTYLPHPVPFICPFENARTYTNNKHAVSDPEVSGKIPAAGCETFVYAVSGSVMERQTRWKGV